VTVTKDDGPGVPGLDDTSIGGTITIDGVDWIKVSDGRNNLTGVEYSMLLMKGILNTGGPVKYCDLYADWPSYTKTNVCQIVNGWYYNANMPTLKKYACRPELYPSPGPSGTWGYPAATGPTDHVAFIPLRADVFNNLSVSQLQNGYLWWTRTLTQNIYGSDGYLKVLQYDGVWIDRPYDATNVYVRPAIYVMR
jgi:hypothetical protein